jgi:hypothetical protein
MGVECCGDPVGHQVEGERVHPEVRQFSEPFDVVLDRTGRQNRPKRLSGTNGVSLRGLTATGPCALVGKIRQPDP